MKTSEWNLLQGAASHQIKSTEILVWLKMFWKAHLDIFKAYHSRALLQLCTPTD